MKFQINSDFKPSGDQPQAIKEIVNSFNENINHQVLLGATGTGKTFTMANVIQQLQKPTLILVHNKTLAMQICSEMKSFFPNNKVEYYVSYFDYYRPEAYKPSNDLYLEKRTQRNSGIEKMRMSALNSLSTEESVIVVASVASIYGCIDPNRYKISIIKLKIDDVINKDEFLIDLERIGYSTEKKNLKILDGEKTIKFNIDREEDSFFSISVSKLNNKIIKLEKL
jgi:excinuclease ABC subunit B